MVKKIYLILGLLLLLPVPALAANVNWTFQGSQNAISVDIVNSTYTQDWMYFLMVSNNTNPWEFPVIGFTGSIMAPFLDSFGGRTTGTVIYLILWGLFLLMVWRQSGKITMPALIACISAGAWGLLMPENAQPWIQILLCAAIASQLFTFFAKE